MLKTRIRGAKKLKKDVEAAFARWNERSMFRLKGVRNLSQSDLDDLTLYADEFLAKGNVLMLMKPLGNLQTILEKYKII